MGADERIPAGEKSGTCPSRGRPYQEMPADFTTWKVLPAHSLRGDLRQGVYAASPPQHKQFDGIGVVGVQLHAICCNLPELVDDTALSSTTLSLPPAL